MFGAYIPLHDCWEAIINLLNNAIALVDGALLEQALENACIIMCPDGAVHTALGKNRKGIITYSLTLTSKYIIDVLKIYPFSGSNFMVHVQLNGTETMSNMVGVMQFRFAFACPRNLIIYDLGDGKLLYLITQHSHWSRLFSPNLLCGCKQGESAVDGHVCHMWTNEEYKSYRQKKTETMGETKAADQNTKTKPKR